MRDGEERGGTLNYCLASEGESGGWRSSPEVGRGNGPVGGATLGEGETDDCVRGSFQYPATAYDFTPIREAPVSRPEGEGQCPIGEKNGLDSEAGRQGRGKSG